jgi:hypothetical protein
MLHAGCHSVCLHSFDVGHNHGRRQIGVFTHILEVAAIQRSAVNVHTGT